MFKKIKQFICKLFNIKACQCDDESAVVEAAEEEKEEESTVQHCGVHVRFRKNCPDCLRAVGVM
jgi:hypothetical protein